MSIVHITTEHRVGDHDWGVHGHHCMHTGINIVRMSTRKVTKHRRAANLPADYIFTSSAIPQHSPKLVQGWLRYVRRSTRCLLLSSGVSRVPLSWDKAMVSRRDTQMEDNLEQSGVFPSMLASRQPLCRGAEQPGPWIATLREGMLMYGRASLGQLAGAEPLQHATLAAHRFL